MTERGVRPVSAGADSAGWTPCSGERRKAMNDDDLAGFDLYVFEGCFMRLIPFAAIFAVIVLALVAAAAIW